MLAPLVALLVAAAPWRPGAPKTHEIDLPRFHIQATDAALGTANLLARELEQDRDAVAARLGGDYPGVTEVRLGEGIDEVLALQPPHERAPRWAAGLADPALNLILLDAQQLRRPGGVGVVLHEVAHLAIAQLGSPDMPHWFQEGLAMHAAAESSPEQLLSLVRVADDRQRIPFDDLVRGFPEGYSQVQVAYAESFDFVTYLSNQPDGPTKLRRLLAAVHAGQAFDAAFASTFGPRAALEAGWLRSLKVRYTWVPLVTGSTTLFGLTALLCLLAWTRVKRRKKRQLASLALEEQALAAAERIRIAELEVPPAPALDPPDVEDKPTLH